MPTNNEPTRSDLSTTSNVQERKLPAPDFADAVYRMITGSVGQMKVQIDLLDEQIEHINRLLNDLQPPRSGKVLIKFLPIDKMIRPVPVVWRRSKVDNGWKFDKVGCRYLPLRAKRARVFSDNWELVAELLAHAAALIAMRSSLLKAVSNMHKSVNMQLKSIGPKSNQLQDRLDTITRDRDAGKFHTFGTKHAPPRDL